MSKNKQKIYEALESKGYTPTFVEFEPISYYSTGREGGWSIEVCVADNDYCFPDWSKVKLPDGLVADIFENDFICYNVGDALKVIELLPHFDSNRRTYDD